MIIINGCKKFFRDKNALVLMIIFPIVLIYILGNLLSNANFADEAVGKLRIGYMITTESPVEIAVISNYIKDVTDDKIQFTQMEGKEAAVNQVADYQLEGFVIFGKDEIQIYEGKDAIKNRTIAALITSISHMSKAVTAIADKVPEKITKLNTGDIDFVQEKEFNANRTMLDYYGVSMVVMILFAGAIRGVNTFKEERQLKTLSRLIVSPMRRTNIFMQKVLGQVPSAVLEIIIIFTVSVLFFHVHYAAGLYNNLVLLLLFLLTSFTTLMVGIVMGMFMEGNPMLYILGPVWLMSFFSGTFAKDIYIKGLTEYLPMYRIQQAAFDITIFGRTGEATGVMLIETAIIVLFIVVGGIRFNKMREVR